MSSADGTSDLSKDVTRPVGTLPGTAPGRSARTRVADYWDERTARWMAGDRSLDATSQRWFDSYAGKGRGAVTLDGFAEPFLGPLRPGGAKPRMALLSHNPGTYVSTMQGHDGVFTDEIKHKGSYSAWAATTPYSRPEWTERFGPNVFHRARLTFAQRWTGDASVGADQLLFFELYPWHSAAVTAEMRPPVDVIDEMVWQPLAELDLPEIWAFGKPWIAMAEAMDLPLLARFGKGGEPFDAVPGWSVSVYELPTASQRLIVSWQAGYAGPPGPKRIEPLRAALGRAPFLA